MHDNYQQVAESGPVTHYTRTVKTPLPNGDTEPNTMHYFSFESGEYIKVLKVSDIGWTITAPLTEAREMGSNEYFESEDECLSKAYEIVQSILTELSEVEQ